MFVSNPLANCSIFWIRKSWRWWNCYGNWGSTVWEGVEFGFNNGCLLADEDRYLDRGKRKQVFTRRFFSVQDVKRNINRLRALLMEAAEVNELLEMEKMRRRKKKK